MTKHWQSTVEIEGCNAQLGLAGSQHSHEIILEVHLFICVYTYTHLSVFGGVNTCVQAGKMNKCIE